MIDSIKQSRTRQFEAALSMMRQCIEACPDEHWEGKIANGSFRWAAYRRIKKVAWTSRHTTPPREGGSLHKMYDL